MLGDVRVVAGCTCPLSFLPFSPPLLPATFISHERPVGRKMFSPCREPSERERERETEKTSSVDFSFLLRIHSLRKIYMCIYSRVFFSPRVMRIHLYKYIYIYKERAGCFEFYFFENRRRGSGLGGSGCAGSPLGKGVGRSFLHSLERDKR